MIELFGQVKGLLKISETCIDNTVFKLHYKASFILLMSFAVLITTTQYFGNPISCIVDDIPEQIMNMYCWVYSTYTVPNKVGGLVGKDVAHPGVGPSYETDNDLKYHQYYQWVGFTLIFQALFFYVPRLLWKSWEEGRVKVLSLDLKRPVIDEESKAARKQIFVEYFSRNEGNHDTYFWRYFFCEILNLANAIFQIIFTDIFLDGEFLSYGRNVLRYSHSSPEEKLDDPMAKVFPKVTKCVFHKYGPSGGIQRYDGLCILPLNILNEKMYVIIWLWFIILVTVSSLVVAYRILSILCPKARRFFSPVGFSSELNNVLERGGIGDWFLLSQLGKNIDTIIFKELIAELATKPKQKTH